MQLGELRGKAIEERNRLKTHLKYKQIKLKQIQEHSQLKEQKALVAKVIRPFPQIRSYSFSIPII